MPNDSIAFARTILLIELLSVAGFFAALPHNFILSAALLIGGQVLAIWLIALKFREELIALQFRKEVDED